MKRLEVRFTRKPGEERIVGQLAETGPRAAGGQVVFEYDPAFLRDPLWLSPFKLPPQPGLIEHRDRAFGPIFGLFDDSLPDGWGLLLMDRYFQQRGSILAEVSALDRLAYLGTRTMGALTYHPPSISADSSARPLDLHGMARASQEVIEGTVREVLPQLLQAGGSPGGATWAWSFSFCGVPDPVNGAVIGTGPTKRRFAGSTHPKEKFSKMPGVTRPLTKRSLD